MGLFKIVKGMRTSYKMGGLRIEMEQAKLRIAELQKSISYYESIEDYREAARFNVLLLKEQLNLNHMVNTYADLALRLP